MEQVAGDDPVTQPWKGRMLPTYTTPAGGGIVIKLYLGKTRMNGNVLSCVDGGTNEN